MSPRILVAGEALVDLLVPGDPRHPVACPGGSPANTAIALARLGTPVAFAGRFGNDRFGDLLLANLADNGVDLSHAVEADEPASLAVVTLGADGVPTYGFHVSGTADWAWTDRELPGVLPSEVLAVHTGSRGMPSAVGCCTGSPATIGSTVPRWRGRPWTNWRRPLTTRSSRPGWPVPGPVRTRRPPGRWTRLGVLSACELGISPDSAPPRTSVLSRKSGT